MAILTAKQQNTRLFSSILKNLLEKRDSGYYLIILRRVNYPRSFKALGTQPTTITFHTGLTAFIRLIAAFKSITSASYCLGIVVRDWPPYSQHGR